MKRLLDKIGERVKIEEIKEVGNKINIIVVQVTELQQQMRIMRNKDKLKGEVERIGDDLIFKERRMQWKLSYYTFISV